MVLAIAVTGCGVEHRSAAYGRAYKESMAMQVKPPAKPPAPTNMALDTQESGVIAGSYVRSLAAKGAQPSDTEPVLYVAPAGRQQGNQSLTPSVPKD
jgi:hypothetical protein